MNCSNVCNDGYACERARSLESNCIKFFFINNFLKLNFQIEHVETQLKDSPHSIHLFPVFPRLEKTDLVVQEPRQKVARSYLLYQNLLPKVEPHHQDQRKILLEDLRHLRNLSQAQVLQKVKVRRKHLQKLKLQKIKPANLKLLFKSNF